MSRQVITASALPGIRVAVDVPEEWAAEHGEGTPSFLAVQPAQGAGPFRDNLVVSLERLPDGAPRDIETVQSAARAQALATVPDVQLVDDRPVEVAGRQGWFRASVHSAPSMVSVMVRQLFAVVEDGLVTIALTTLPFRDPEAARLFEEMAATISITAEEGSR